MDVRSHGEGDDDTFDVGRRDNMIPFMSRILEVGPTIKRMVADGVVHHFNAEKFARYWWTNHCSTFALPTIALLFNSNQYPVKQSTGVFKLHPEWEYHPYHFNELREELSWAERVRGIEN